MDLHDVGKNSGSGLHMASLAGAWIAVVAGLGGMRDNGGELHFAPRLPSALQRLAFRVSFRGRTLVVEVKESHASYELLEGEPFEVQHHGEVVRLEPGEPVHVEVPPLPRGPECTAGPARPRAATARPSPPALAAPPPQPLNKAQRSPCACLARVAKSSSASPAPGS